MRAAVTVVVDMDEREVLRDLAADKIVAASGAALARRAERSGSRPAVPTCKPRNRPEPRPNCPRTPAVRTISRSPTVSDAGIRTSDINSNHNTEDNIQHWLARQLAVAPPLTPGQLHRLQLLLAPDHAADLKFA